MIFKRKKKNTEIPIDVKAEFIKEHLRQKLHVIDHDQSEISRDITQGYNNELIRHVAHQIDRDDCYDAEARELKKKIRMYLIKHFLRKTIPEEYARWLYGYLKTGGKIGNYYDWDFDVGVLPFFTAKRSFVFPTAFWGNPLAFDVLVPNGLTVIVAVDIGHCHVYNSDFTVSPFAPHDKPPCYNDILMEIKKLDRR